MTISKKFIGGVKFATLLVVSCSVGVALEARLESVPASAPATIAQVAAAAPAGPSPAGSWWKAAADVLR